jgi:hypothetical protein
VAAFGCRELAGAGSVSVGRTKTHVAVRVGPWTLLLNIDATGRYPNAEDVIPRPRANTSRLQFSPEDAALLIRVLPELPGREDDQSPITLELGSPPAVRAGDPQRGAVQEAVLASSTTSGPHVRLCMDRRLLRRALQLGFTAMQVFKADQPLVCRDDRRTYVWMPFTEKAALPPSPAAVRVQEPTAAEPNPSPPTERRTEPMPANSNGQGPPEGRDGANSPASLLDPIAEAEALRGLLHEAASRSARLVAALKQQRRQTRVLQQAVQSIRQLPLDR